MYSNRGTYNRGRKKLFRGRGYKVQKAKASISTMPLNPVQTRQVKRFLRSDMETKHHDKNVTATSVYILNDYAACLTDVIQSSAQSTDTSRIGDQITVLGLNIRMRFVNQVNAGLPGDTNDSTIWRVLIVQDKSANTGAILNLSQVLLQFGGSINIMSQRNIDHKETIQVLYDRTFKTEFGQGIERYVHFSVPMKYAKKKIQYVASSALNQTNGIYILIMNASANVVSDPTVEYSSRLYFKDA